MEGGGGREDGLFKYDGDAGAANRGMAAQLSPKAKMRIEKAFIEGSNTVQRAKVCPVIFLAVS